MPWKFDQQGVQRNISPAEYALIAKLLAVTFPGTVELRQQLDSPGLRVSSTGEILRIEFLTNPGILAMTKYREAVEANSADADGMGISVSLHVVEGRLYELEVYRF